MQTEEENQRLSKGKEITSKEREELKLEREKNLLGKGWMDKTELIQDTVIKGKYKNPKIMVKSKYFSKSNNNMY